MPVHLNRRPLSRTALALAIATVLGPWAAAPAAAANCTWVPVNGNWAGAGNWSCGIVPSGGPDTATVGAGKTVTVNTGQSILVLDNSGIVNIDAAALTLASGGTTTNTAGFINIANGALLNQVSHSITGGTISTTGTGALVGSNSNANFLNGVTLNGTLDLASSTFVERVTGGLVLGGSAGTVNVNSNSVFSFSGDQTLGGTGTVVLGGTGGSNRALGLEGNTVLTIGSNIVVRGENGTIGQAYLVGGNQSLVNNGRISADVAGGSISLAPSNGITNNGVLEAKNGGTLVLNSDVIGNVGSSIAVGAGSTVLQNGVALSGVINTTGNGTFRASNSNSNFFSGVTLNGNLDLASTTGIERVTGGLVLNGSINVNNNSVLSFNGDQTLGGTGTVVLGDTGGSNRALGMEGNTVLTIGSNVVVRGQNGTIGQAYLIGGNQSLVNNGRISADVAGGSISLAPSNGTTNNGVLEAKNGGTLVLNSDVIGNVGSSIAVGAGSTVLQNGVALSGVINTTGNGTFRASNSNGNFFSGVTLNGNLDLASTTGIERVTGGLVLNGSINVNNNSVLSFNGDQTISGTGTVALGDTGGSNRALGMEGNTVLTIGSNVVVRGQNGTIGQAYLIGGNQSLINNGRISADVLGGSVSLAPSGGITNNGVLEAQNGGTLVLNGNVIGNIGSSIVAGAGSTVLQNSVTLSGVINSAGTGNFRVSNSNSNFLDGVTFNGPLDLASATSVERVTNGLALNGSINVDANSVLSFAGNQSLTGNGTIVLGSTGASNRALGLEGNTVLTLGAGVTVRGQNGTVGQAYLSGGAQQITNNGSIVADVGGGTVFLVTGLTQNNSFIGAANGGTLRLDGAVTQSAAGQINVANGSSVVQNGVTITGGVLNTAGTGSMTAANSNSNFLSGFTVNGLLDMASGTGIERVVGGLTLGGGTISVNSNSVLSFNGDQTLGGTGTVLLGNTGPSNRALGMEGNTTLTLGAGVTVRGVNGTLGQAYLVGGAQNIVNNGAINSDGGGTIAIVNTGALTNNGTLRAQSGTLNVQPNVSGTGTLQVDSAGTMTLANGGNTQAKLVMGAAGAAINIGTGNLTINGDYTNAGAGSGNSFDRRAGITGAGQVVAGGNAAQVITGSGVTGGNTGSATLTLGNVRVGANTFNYQIGNSGSTGPTLRGAIQTSVNGANLTDARLSGSGVAASNYSAGAPGAGSGDLGVTFTAASAGALAPLTGQVINLRSNFQNIADQKLNIVLAGGAAAYNAAVGSTTPTPLVVANQRIGGNNSTALTVANTAPAGAFSEDLRASFGSSAGSATNNGGVANTVVAGQSNGSALRVGVDTSSAGARTGSVTINYQTTGTVAGVSNGLGVAGANAAQTIQVSGNVYQAASGSIVTPAYNFGTLQVGQTVSQNLVLRNTAIGPAGFVEDLNASFGAASGNGLATIVGSGALSGIAAGNNSSDANGTMSVGVTGVAAGNFSGSIAVNYQTAGAVAGVGNGLGTAAAGGDNYGVSGVITTGVNVVNQASPQINNPTINLGAVRVGAAAPSAAVSISNIATAAPQAALNASIAPAGGPVSAAGSFSLLAPGGTNNTSLVVGLGTGTAGNYTGANAGKATVTLVSDASNIGGCAPNCQLNLASQTVNVEGKVYTAAVGSVTTAGINFGIVRVGDTPNARNITIANTAAVSGLNDTLSAGIAGLAGAFSAPASVTGIAAQTSANAAVSLATGTAGVYNQTATVSLSSHDADLADVSAGASVQVSVHAQVNRLANAVFGLVSGRGTLSGNGSSYTLDLGSLFAGSGAVASSLRLGNDVAGPADALKGSYDLSSVNDFGASGFIDPTDIEAGASELGLGLQFAPTALGLYTDTITFTGYSWNADNADYALGKITLNILARVVQQGTGGEVPEPSTLALLLAAGAAGWMGRRRTGAAARRTGASA